jgi:hypothetical protein
MWRGARDMSVGGASGDFQEAMWHVKTGFACGEDKVPRCQWRGAGAVPVVPLRPPLGIGIEQEICAPRLILLSRLRTKHGLEELGMDVVPYPLAEAVPHKWLTNLPRPLQDV